jgi:hypothetical protein
MANITNTLWYWLLIKIQILVKLLKIKLLLSNMMIIGVGVIMVVSMTVGDNSKIGNKFSSSLCQQCSTFR